MRFTHKFLDRPILATIVSIFITLLGLGAMVILPIAQYPEIIPPTVQVTTSYPGASAEVVSQTVAAPLDQEINGVENMLYMSSQPTGYGRLTITVTFSIGTDLNVAQMLAQNRVQDALPRLPKDVQRLGVQVRKVTPNILLAVHLYSPNGSRDVLYLSNYATLRVKDALARLPGIGDVQLFGGRDYAMRIWFDPDKVAAYKLTSAEVLAALRAQALQVSAGVLTQPPVPGTGAFQINVQTLGRLSTPEQFAGIVIKNDGQGHVTRLRNIGRAEIGAADYGSTAYTDRGAGLPLLIFAQPGANSLSVEYEVLDTMKTLSEAFSQGVGYKIIYDPTVFIRKSVNEVVTTIFIAVALVIAVVFVFLQTWRATLIPMIASVFISGIFGLFFKQFAVTIAASTVISAFVSLTLSPALCALLLKPHGQGAHRPNLAARLLQNGFGLFNRAFEWLSNGYGKLTARLVRALGVVLNIYAALIGAISWQLSRTPTGFIPEQDQGYLITVVQLPPGASLARTDAVVKRVIDIILTTKGLEYAAPLAGLDATSFTIASNASTNFAGLPSLYGHNVPGVTAATVLTDLRQRLSVVQHAFILTIPPLPVQGLGSSGGLKPMLEDRAGVGPQRLVGAANALVAAVFGAAALFVFLVLATKCESWKLSLAVVFIVPMCLLAAVIGLVVRGMPIDILAQIGFVVLVGLAAKNAILIVEFAHGGRKPVHAPRMRRWRLRGSGCGRS